MKIASEIVGDVTVVILQGRLDSTTSGPADAQIMQLLGNADKAILDLEQVDYVASAGLRIVLLLAKRFNQRKAKVVLCSLHPNVREVFQVSGFISILNVEPDRLAALSRLGS